MQQLITDYYINITSAVHHKPQICYIVAGHIENFSKFV